MYGGRLTGKDCPAGSNIKEGGCIMIGTSSFVYFLSK